MYTISISTPYYTGPGLVTFHTYLNNLIAIRLSDPDTGERIAIPTVSLPIPDLPLRFNPSTDVIVRNYSEHRGMLHTLIVNEIIEPPYDTTQTGFTYDHLCTLTPKALSIAKEQLQSHGPSRSRQKESSSK